MTIPTSTALLTPLAPGSGPCAVTPTCPRCPTTSCRTDPTRDHRVLAHALGWRLPELAQLTRNGVEASWLDATAKADLLARVEQQVTTLVTHPAPVPQRTA